MDTVIIVNGVHNSGKSNCFRNIMVAVFKTTTG